MATGVEDAPVAPPTLPAQRPLRHARPRAVVAVTRAPGRLTRLVVRIARKSDRDRVLGLAAETAFFAVLGVFPALLMTAAVLGSLEALAGPGTAERVQSEVVAALRLVLTDEAAGAVESVEQLFTSGVRLLTLASALALVSLSTGFATVVNALNLAYSVPETRGWWHRRLLGLVLGVVSVLLAAVGLALVVVGPLLGQGEQLAGVVGVQVDVAVWQHLRWPVAFLALVLWATTLCHVAPARRTAWRRDLPGGALAGVLWLAATYGLNAYLRVVSDGNPVLGALGGGLILMVWVYLLSLGLLVGAELNAVLQARSGARDVGFDRWAASRGRAPEAQPRRSPPP